ncbi:WD40 repeat domain-containing protein [Cellulomonas fengjieae]|uniref:WD40 repeat domain-containing protein n=1 Tax=Cellulomonas fengjieae TaxID=2819978 RepID=UPI001AAFA58D|nr:WD40 repeat domain-containing protein [Cellulomonas fengjieae]MBO3103461.1 WD40 repeat domain-containing protein [Cellulomonas fengjieae]
MNTRVSRTARWNPRLVEEPLAGAASEPVPLVSDLYNNAAFGWLPTSERLSPFAVFDASTGPFLPVLAAGGTSMVFERARYDGGSDDLPLVQRRRILGVYRYDFTSGRDDRAGFDAVQGKDASVFYAPSPDGTALAIAQQWWPAWRPGVRSVVSEHRVSLTVGGFSDEPPRTVLELSGVLEPTGESSVVQWSPDGSTVAVSMMTFTPRGSLQRTTLIADVTTGAHTQVPAALLGSVAWDHEGHRLLVVGDDDVPRVLDTRTGTSTPVPALGARVAPVNSAGRPRALGWADERRLLVAVCRGTTTRVCVLDPDEGIVATRVRWTAGPLDSVRLAPMPLGFWS